MSQYAERCARVMVDELVDHGNSGTWLKTLVGAFDRGVSPARFVAQHHMWVAQLVAAHREIESLKGERRALHLALSHATKAFKNNEMGTLGEAKPLGRKSPHAAEWIIRINEKEWIFCSAEWFKISAFFPPGTPEREYRSCVAWALMTASVDKWHAGIQHGRRVLAFSLGRWRLAFNGKGEIVSATLLGDDKNAPTDYFKDSPIESKWAELKPTEDLPIELTVELDGRFVRLTRKGLFVSNDGTMWRRGEARKI